MSLIRIDLLDLHIHFVNDDFRIICQLKNKLKDEKIVLNKLVRSYALEFLDETKEPAW